MDQAHNLWSTATALEWDFYFILFLWISIPSPKSHFPALQGDKCWTKNEYLVLSGYKICEHDSGKVSPMERSGIEGVLERPFYPRGSQMTKSKLRAAEWVPGEIPGWISAPWKHTQGFTFPPQTEKLNPTFEYGTVKILLPVFPYKEVIFWYWAVLQTHIQYAQ